VPAVAGLLLTVVGGVVSFMLTGVGLPATLDALDTGVRGGPEPDDITLENFGRPIPEA
jgi:hypothetical protein